jgi:hypothetical protein
MATDWADGRATGRVDGRAVDRTCAAAITGVSATLVVICIGVAALVVALDARGDSPTALREFQFSAQLVMCALALAALVGIIARSRALPLLQTRANSTLVAPPSIVDAIPPAHWIMIATTVALGLLQAGGMALLLEKRADASGQPGLAAGLVAALLTAALSTFYLTVLHWADGRKTKWLFVSARYLPELHLACQSAVACSSVLNFATITTLEAAYVIVPGLPIAWIATVAAVWEIQVRPAAGRRARGRSATPVPRLLVGGAGAVPHAAGGAQVLGAGRLGG